MSHSRRTFLKTVLLASGATFLSWEDLAAQSAPGALPGVRTSMQHFGPAHAYLRDHARPFPPFPAGRKPLDAVVIGAGPAGIAAAWRLKRAGKSVVLLENEPAPGGALSGIDAAWNGVPYGLGAVAFRPFDGPWRELFSDLELSAVPFGTEAVHLGDGRVTTDFWSREAAQQIPMSGDARREYHRFFRDLQEFLLPPYPLADAPAAVLDRYGTMSALDFVRSYQSDALQTLLDLYCRTWFGTALANASAYALVHKLRPDADGNCGGGVLSFVDGLRAVARRAAHYFKADDVMMRALALNVVNYDDGTVDVNLVHTDTGEAGTITARAVIVATQKRIAAHIVEGMPTDQAAAMRELHYAPVVCVALCCDRPLFEGDASLIYLGDEARTFTVLRNARAIATRGGATAFPDATSNVYVAVCARPEEDRPLLEQDSWLVGFAQQVNAALESLLPAAHGHVREAHVMSWGHPQVIPIVGELVRRHLTVTQPVGRVLFAGADNELGPGVDLAMMSGFRAAEQVQAMVHD